MWRPEEYERYTQRALAELPPLSSRLTELERFFYGSSHDADLDAAGRIMVPGFLGEHAGLAKEVIVVGVGDRLELWDRGGWNDHRPTLLGGVAEITARVDDRCSASAPAARRGRPATAYRGVTARPLT